MNLQAMLNIENIDEVIELLERNNWDESAAACNYYAKEVQQQNRPPASQSHHQASAHQDYDDQVRAPMQFRQE
eukprot:CAMPEP_0202965578 /NCGR_PEP_ID=MMETSP1396-20130829/9502_1 /ASSEMBLY_ACC=CAM_ASM_000872 /TAXON_ID= /ORGANISM="Pseudokeronopsis sp., Strain Brazil" /LENGTH=72 /DNA_ID=CAMNT_0049688331 /DNA_START=82 /DNA_END=300 /DNA_ORIENTATION=+